MRREGEDEGQRGKRGDFRGRCRSSCYVAGPGPGRADRRRAARPSAAGGPVDHAKAAIAGGHRCPLRRQATIQGQQPLLLGLLLLLLLLISWRTPTPSVRASRQPDAALLGRHTSRATVWPSRIWPAARHGRRRGARCSPPLAVHPPTPVEDRPPDLRCLAPRPAPPLTVSLSGKGLIDAAVLWSPSCGRSHERRPALPLRPRPDDRAPLPSVTGRPFWTGPGLRASR